MNNALKTSAPSGGGIHIQGTSKLGNEAARKNFLRQLESLGLDGYVNTSQSDARLPSLRFQLRAELADEWAPGCDTIQLGDKLALDAQGNACDLEREILLSMLLAPVAFEFPSHDELASAVRVRKNIVAAARRTSLAFHATEAERPAEYWTYDEDRGFTILPGKPLVTALQKATQPDVSGKLYSFSCYRATEYVILLGIAQELEKANPELFTRLQQQWNTRAIKSGEFHEVFLREYGSMGEPLPPKFYVPGDRLWFRNPDAHSSDVTGYEGSWVFYLGGGLFTNFWNRDKPFTLATKCLEIFHWRNATCRDHAGELRIDEEIVEQRVRESMNDPAEVERILQVMLRLRDPQGVYVDGGCIDTSREYPRLVCPGTSDLVLPAC
ncbi:lipoprotein [Sulfurimicrobium lacus]|uniref:Lipoprotein n=1 Tax=Sulfurimicrobium lacus TaxID=2715678 RepID=A0A6F8VCS4_9PROT|nr:hypothetical protein [Sulfurimicrobium lacus]BCB27474.1 lipoprotein [Sulfurimicrobium lacus]